MTKFYDTVDPESYEKRYLKNLREYYMHKHWKKKIILILHMICKNKIVLDLGSGTSTYSKIISKVSSECIGIDISIKMLSYAKKRIHKDAIHLVLGDAEVLPFRPESFDALVSIGLFEYVDRTKVVLQIKEILKHDGLLIISCPNKYGACRFPLRLLYSIMKRPRAQCEPSLKEILGLFNKNGFTIMTYQMDDYLFPFPYFLEHLISFKFYEFFEKHNPLRVNLFSNVMLLIFKKN